MCVIYIYTHQVGSKEIPWWIELLLTKPDRFQIVYDNITEGNSMASGISDS